MFCCCGHAAESLFLLLCVAQLCSLTLLSKRIPFISVFTDATWRGCCSAVFDLASFQPAFLLLLCLYDLIRPLLVLHCFRVFLILIFGLSLFLVFLFRVFLLLVSFTLTAL